jgi:hypothetical protein
MWKLPRLDSGVTVTGDIRKPNHENRIRNTDNHLSHASAICFGPMCELYSEKLSYFFSLV